MINREVLVGRLTKDPELRYTPNGIAVATFSIAINRPFTNESGERAADFPNCVAWRKTAEAVANYCKKGNQIGVEGRLQTRSYEAQDGTKRYVTEVICDSVTFLEPKGTDGSQGNASKPSVPTGGTGNGNGGYGGYSRNNDPFFDEGQPIDISDDELPF